MFSNVQILILFNNNENNRKKVSKYYELYYQNRSSNISFGLPFEIFCPVLTLTKIGSAGYKSYIYDQLALKPLKLVLDHITQEGKVEFYEIRFHSLTSFAHSL
jgi:hypothetical protein